MHKWPSKSCTAPRPHRRGRSIAAANHDLHVFDEPPFRGHRGQDLAQHRSHGDEVWHLRPIHTAPGQQPTIVIDVIQIAVVGQQVRKDRGLRRGHSPRQTHAQIIGRLEQLMRLPINLGEAVLDEQNVRQGIVARMHRHAPGQTQPAR